MACTARRQDVVERWLGGRGPLSDLSDLRKGGLEVQELGGAKVLWVPVE